MDFAKHTIVIAGACISLVLVLSAIMYTLFVPAAGFPVNTVVRIPEGSGIRDIALLLKKEHVVRSAILLQSLVVFSGKESGVFAGDYIFDDKKNIFKVARAITNGEFGMPAVRLTVPEGLSNIEIGRLVTEALGEETGLAFISAASTSEGYLFPDTYFFSANVTAQTIIDAMKTNFDEKISTIQPSIDAFGKPLSEVIVMASLLEKEARTSESRRLISGILWNRMENDMPLQVDATFAYFLGKNTFELTLEDLATDSPFNTYTNKGLPPSAIANPGLDAIEAAIHPTPSEYV